MKRLLYGIGALVILVLGVTFAARNAQPVELQYYFDFHWQAPLSFMLLTTLTLGIAVGFLTSLAMVARMQRRLLTVRRENRILEQELHQLRTLPIRDAV